MLEVGPRKLGLCPSRLSPSGICLRPTSNRGMWLLIEFWWKDGPPFPRKVTDFSQWHRFGRILEKLGKKDTCLVSRTSRLYPGFDGTANCPHVSVWNEGLLHTAYFLQPQTAPKRCSRMPNNSPSKIHSREEHIFLASYLAEIIWNHHSLGMLFAEVLLKQTPPNTNRIGGRREWRRIL